MTVSLINFLFKFLLLLILIKRTRPRERSVIVESQAQFPYVYQKAGREKALLEKFVKGIMSTLNKMRLTNKLVNTDLKAGKNFFLGGFLSLCILGLFTFCVILLAFFAFKNVPEHNSMSVSEKQILRNKTGFLIKVAYKSYRNTPMMPEEYKVSLIVECDHSPTTKIGILGEK